MSAQNPTVSITQQVFDFMMIEVNNADINSIFNYTITNNANECLRKGNSKGQLVQLV